MRLIDRIVRMGAWSRGHWRLFRDEWRRQKETAPETSPVEPAFLPAAIEIMETPASPAGRWTMILIFVFFGLAVLWSVIGRIDMVAIAPGSISPRGNVKVIQSAELGVIQAIHVENGDQVHAGDVLIEFDPTSASADEDRINREALMARINAARGAAILSYLDDGSSAYQAPENADAAMIRMQERLIRARIAEYEAQRAAFEKRLAERHADLQLVEKQLIKLRETLPLLQQQVDARAKLLEKGLTSRLLFLELQERYVAHRQDIKIEADRLIKANAAVATVEQQLEQLAQEFYRTTLSEHADYAEQAAALEQELRKATTRRRLQDLVSPVDGVVQQLAYHTIGGVVQPGDAVLVVVPGTAEQGVELQVNANVLNRDIGFVRLGQPVEIKIEAFPFTKHGVINGNVKDIARAAVQDEELGLVYPAKISLLRSEITADGRLVSLGPGMAVTAEIKTGNRRLIEFLLSPLLRYQDEALRER